MRAFLPAVYPADGYISGEYDEFEPWYNCVPWPLRNNEVGVVPRSQLDKDSSFTANSSADRGRGIFAFAGTIELYLDQDTYYYSGGSQDLTVTSSPGYAGNTGFNEEYSASFVEHKISGVPNMVIVNAGHTSTHASAKHGNVWYVPDGTTAPASISDANMPGNNGVSLIRGGASLDGYFFVGDINGQIHNSNLNDITTWNALDFLTAERYPDNGVYLGRHSDNLVWIGTRSIEFFYNGGNASGSPLARRQDISYSVGCCFPNSVYQQGDIIYFVGNSPEGIVSVYKLENFQLIKVSNISVDNRLREQSAPSGILYDISDLDALDHAMWLSGGVLNGVSGLFLTWNFYFSFFYNPLLNTWSRVSYDAAVTYVGGASTGWNNILPISGFDQLQTSGGASRMQMINGTIVRLNAGDNDTISDLAADNDPDVFLTFQTWDAGTDKKKRINSVRVITESQANNSTANDPFTVQLRWRDLGRKYDIASSVQGQYNTGRSTDLNVRSTKITRLGTTRARRFRIDYTTGHGPLTPIKGLEIDYDIVE